MSVVKARPSSVAKGMTGVLLLQEGNTRHPAPPKGRVSSTQGLHTDASPIPPGD